MKSTDCKYLLYRLSDLFEARSQALHFIFAKRHLYPLPKCGFTQRSSHSSFSLKFWNWQMVISLLIFQEASLAIPLLSPVLVPVAQNIGPFLSEITSSPTIRLGVRYLLEALSKYYDKLLLFLLIYLSYKTKMDEN